MFRRLQLAGMLVVVCATVYAQVGADKRVCTDLSGKIRVECPAEPQVAPDTSGVPGPATAPAAVAAKAVPAGAVQKGPLVRVADKPAPADDSAPSSPPVFIHPKVRTPPRYSSLEASLPQNFLADQKNFWTSPLRLHVQDASWLLPLAVGITAVNIADPVIERKLPNGASFIQQSKSFSNYGAAAYAGMVGGAYLLSRATNNDHMRETAVLSGEAAVDTLLISEGVKYLAGRDRPLEGDGTGAFRNGGSSFPSLHSADAFAIASVVAHEYPGPLTQLLAYGGAAAISAARVTGRQHFTSDVLVGGALGWFIGRQVYNAHSDRENRELYGTFERAPRERGPRDPAYMGSTYVPLDSWVYSAIDRLAAMGYIDTAFEGMRPWTRLECAGMIEEAGAKLAASDSQSGVAAQLFDELTAEFAFESGRLAGQRNLGAGIDSVYTRVTGISGQPLTDGFHFGQTIINDFGRPYQAGFNNVTGVEAHAEAGPLVVYVRGEYEHAPEGQAVPLQARDLIRTIDYLASGPPGTPVAPINRVRLLDSYVAANIDNWQISFGPQSLSWGPGDGGSMMISDNAEPITMLRISRVLPLKLPGIFGWLGPLRTEFFLGQLTGQHFVVSPDGFIGDWNRALNPQPFIHGQKISFKPTPNFEFGFSRTTVYGGPGYPMNAQTFWRSLIDTGNAQPGSPEKPGDRRSGLDFNYRLPGLRNWVSFYADGFTEDQFSPVAYWDRSVWRAGLYFSHLPGLEKLDLRTEGVYSDNPIGGAVGPGYFYFNGTWRNGYTNDGQLIGNWIGRAGQGAQAWATYHFNPRELLQLNFRHQKVSREFLPGGGTLTNASVRGDLWVHSYMSLSSTFQYETWKFPILSQRSQSDVSTSIQFSFSPSQWLKHEGR
jgi:membrane-associated phospholipid phosphatase